VAAEPTAPAPAQVARETALEQLVARLRGDGAGASRDPHAIATLSATRRGEHARQA
jgi:hypothetical protein